jgi:cytochrome c peroxidase
MRKQTVVMAVGCVCVATILSACATPQGGRVSDDDAELTAKERLGKLLFFDQDLSTPPGQSCASCHSPDAGFGDPGRVLPVSRGAIAGRFGNRNDLTAAYASFIPPLRYDEDEEMWVGGLFWDGRAADLAEQAKGPPLNPLEMANPNAEAVVEAISRAEYSDLFREVYGADALDDATTAYDYFADAVAAYESTSEFSPFDSKYDLYLAGEVQLTDRELRGLELFEREDKGNCAACHPSKGGAESSSLLFTDHTYDNLGVPRNPESPFLYLPEELNPDGADYTDPGLGAVVNDPALNGLFRVPTLRNVAVTQPYMHNGVFKTLYQVVAFYNTRDVAPWPAPEWSNNVNRDELGDLKLTTQEIDDIVAFLHTLTDGYEVPSGR